MISEPQAKLASEAYQKYKDGDSLTDAEVATGAKVFLELGHDLNMFGPVFRLPAVELIRVGHDFVTFKEARTRK